MSGKIALSCGKMPWFQEGAPIRYPALCESIQTDVLIVGGGLSGLMTAYFLTAAGATCTVVEKGVVCSGASRFFAGFSCDGGSSLSRLFSLYGKDSALRLWRRVSDAVNEVETLSSEVAPTAGYKRKDSFFFTQKEENVSEMKEEFRLRNFSGFSCEFLSENDALSLFSFPVSGGVYTKGGGGEVDPSALACGLAARLTLCGGRIFEESEIVSIAKKGEKSFVSKTKTGYEIVSSSVCDCRGIGLLKRYPDMGKRKTVFGICSAEAPNLSGWPSRCVMKNDDKRRPLFVSGAESQRLLLFGRDSSLVSPGGGLWGVDAGFLSEYQYENLKITAEEMFLGESLSFPFSGDAGYVKTSDRLPYAGEDRNLPGYFYACSEGINTLPNALLCGKILAGLLTGNKSAEDSLFSMRKTLP